MSSIFSLTPTFTQGLLLGQLSVLLLLFLVLKYLFLEKPSPNPAAPSLPTLTARQTPRTKGDTRDGLLSFGELESAEWFNVVLEHITQAYRRELRNNLTGPAAEEAARVRIEAWINNRLGTSMLDKIVLHSINTGSCAPKLLSARIRQAESPSENTRIECEITYADNVSWSLSTSVLFHYPTPSFARLPVSLTMSLEVFTAKVTVTPPSPSDPAPCLTLTLDPSFTLDLTTNSLLGSRAKLSDVPKVHEMITERIRSLIATRGTWKILLPGVRTKDVVDILQKKAV
ncbi:ERMES complex subunit mmm1 [Tulasnella sp. 403]|nr:ERMES complex subunit mmm1 [Tulasnella sp. 403]